MVITIAERAAKISNPELRDLAAYALDEIHGWRCGFFCGMDECEAVEDVFTDDGTVVERVLQPVLRWRNHYIHNPFSRWVDTLREWDDDNDGNRWRWNNDFLKPWEFLPKPRNEFRWIAQFAAARTWYSADQFIADYVARAAKRLDEDLHGVPMFFVYDVDSLPAVESARYGDDIGIDCYRYSLRVLAEMAREALEHDDLDEFADALAEAMKLGMLWD